jgi:hypothetical protein
MHPVFRKQCERDGLEEECSWLGDLELTKKDANQQLLKDFDYWLWNY